jgi:hypothetical protein
MPTALHNQSDIVPSRKINTSFHVGGRRGIDNINRIALARARRIWNRDAAIVCPIGRIHAHWILVVEGGIIPGSLEICASSVVVLGPVVVAGCSRRSCFY